MKIVLLAGGFGTRLSEESQFMPKPLIEIGGKPILWHIMKIYASYGFNEFVILLGYKGNLIKQYFNNYFLNRTEKISEYFLKDSSAPLSCALFLRSSFAFLNTLFRYSGSMC